MDRPDQLKTVMAGKRHSGVMDHTMYNKISRVEAAPQNSIPCTGKAIPKDLQVCKNFLTYPLSNTEGQLSFNPWSSTTAYLQYAGNALHQNLQSGGISKCQRQETERRNNPLQLSNNSSSHFPAHRHPVNNYHMSPSRAYATIAVPRPVYRNPSSFIDKAYQTQEFQSMGVNVGSQTLCPPNMEWSCSTHFPYSSSPLYVSGMKSFHPTHNGYLEATTSPSSLPRSVQELGSVHRHRTEINSSVGSSPSCYQDEVFTDRLRPFAQHNIPLLCTEGNVSVGKTRNSAFTTPTHEHYKCINYQGNPDTRIGHMYSKAYYDSAMDSCHQRSALYSCNVDKSVSPLSVRGSIACAKAQKLNSGYANPEPRGKAQVDDGTQISQAQAAVQLQINGMSTTREPQICQGQLDQASLYGSGQMNRRNLCVNSSNMDKEHVLGSAHVNSDLNERALYEKSITEHNSHVSFLQQNRTSKILLADPTKCMVANESVKENSFISKVPSSPGSLHTLGHRRMSNATFDKQTVHSRNQAANTAHENSTVLKSPGSIYQHQMSNDNRTSRDEAIQSPRCALPQASKLGADGPESPPMPVINDVFSLAPYRAYLEGTAPHPFPSIQESDVKNNTSTSFSPPRSEKAGEMEKEIIPDIVNTGYHNTEGTQQQADTKTRESRDAQIRSNTMNAEVLDLSLKKTRTCSSTQDQGKTSHSSHKPSPKLVNEKNVSQVSGGLSIKESCLPQLTRITAHSKNELHVPHTTVKTPITNMENSPSQASEKTSRLAQCTAAKTFICQSQDSRPSQARETRAQEYQRSPGASEVTQSLAHENFAKHSLHANKNLLSLLHNTNYTYPTKIQSLYLNEKSKSQLTQNLSQQLEGNCTSPSLKNFTPQAKSNCRPQTDHPLESYQSNATKCLSLQAAETPLPHKHQETDTSQSPETLHLQQNCSSRANETISRHSYYNCISEPVHSSPQSANISLFVNPIQTPTTFLPQTFIYSSPAAVFCSKNLNLPSQQHQNQSTEKRARKSVDSCQSETSLSGSENDGTGFSSSKAFMIRKYKLMKFSNSGPEVQEANSKSASHALPRMFLLPSDGAQSLPPSAPESSPTLGEANVSLASADELAPTGSGQQFSELHRSVRAAVTSSVARSPSSLLEDWLEKTKDVERSKTSAKTKSGSRPNDPSPESPGRDIWQEFDGVRLRLFKLLSQLETFMFTRSCPFPHVIRAGAIFIPIYLVKEVLFAELGTSIDRVLQKHKVELRPTTLSEEKLLRETNLKDCPSRMLKLLALKQLPDVYPDLLHMFCEHTIHNHLGECTVLGLCADMVKPDVSLTFKKMHWYILKKECTIRYCKMVQKSSFPIKAQVWLFFKWVKILI